MSAQALKQSVAYANTCPSPLAGWLGGKYYMARRIVERIPQHHCYVEPFAGAAWVLFRKEPSKVEVINDINQEVTNLYRVIKHHPEEFRRQFQWALVSREVFNLHKRTDPEILTDIQRAARFQSLLKMSFNGKYNETFAASVAHKHRFNLERLDDDINAIHDRLKRVLVECGPYGDVIQRYDRPGTFFYVDPPYWGHENDYGKGFFTRDDFGRLAVLLAGIKGKFLLSLNNTPEIREIFSGFQIEEERTQYNAKKNAVQSVTELLIRNY